MRRKRVVGEIVGGSTEREPVPERRRKIGGTGGAKRADIVESWSKRMPRKKQRSKVRGSPQTVLDSVREVGDD